MANKKNNPKKKTYRSFVTGRFSSAKNMQKELSEIGLTLADYEAVEKRAKRLGVDKKELYFEIREKINSISENYNIDIDFTKLKQVVTESKGVNFFLNDKKISKKKLMVFISEYNQLFDHEVFQVFVNLNVKGRDFSITFDEELANEVNKDGNDGYIQDSNGNYVIVSKKSKRK